MGSSSKSATWLGWAVALTTATQLRRGPLGPGEAMLAMWLAGTIGGILMRDRVVLAKRARVLFLFWAGALLLLLTGWVVAAILGRAAQSAPRDFVAYILVSMMTLLVLARRDAASEIGGSANAAMIVSTVSLFVVLLLALITPRIGPIVPLYDGVRYRGWSENPNQVALTLCMVPFVAYYRLLNARSRLRRLSWFVIIALAVITGLASLSDGLAIAWTAGVFLMLAHTWLMAFKRGRARITRAVIVFALVPAAVLGALLLGGPRIAAKIDDRIENVYQAGGQGSIRLNLSMNAIQAARESPVLGLGPGGHSGWEGPYGEMEAHNTLVDWYSATGLVGLILYVGLIAFVAYRVRGCPPLMAALATLLIFGLSGYHLRHPIFWLYLMFIYLGSTVERDTPVQQIRLA